MCVCVCGVVCMCACVYVCVCVFKVPSLLVCSMILPKQNYIPEPRFCHIMQMTCLIGWLSDVLLIRTCACRIWDIECGACLRLLEGHDDLVR